MPRVGQPSLPKPPSAGLLRRYGLTATDWYEMARRQKGICPVCKSPFADRKLVIDHEHVKGWRAFKRKKGKRPVRVMTPEERRPHVRGILHMWCNGFVRSWLTRERAESILSYLVAHEQRKNGAANAKSK